MSLGELDGSVSNTDASVRRPAPFNFLLCTALASQCVRAEPEQEGSRSARRVSRWRDSIQRCFLRSRTPLQVVNSIECSASPSQRLSFPLCSVLSTHYTCNYGLGSVFLITHLRHSVPKFLSFLGGEYPIVPHVIFWFLRAIHHSSAVDHLVMREFMGGPPSAEARLVPNPHLRRLARNKSSSQKAQS